MVTTQNLDAERTLANSEDDVTSVTKKINEIETKHNPATAQTAEIPSVNLAIDSRNSGNEVTPIDETQLQQELPLVTSSVTQGKNKAVTEENTVLEAIASQEVPSTDTATPDPWLTPENLQSIAGDLSACVESNDPQMLADLRSIYPVSALQAAFKLLSSNRQAQIKRWVQEQNRLNYTTDD